jgi:dUTPase
MGYRGHLKGMVYNHLFKSVKIDGGSRLFQICAPDLSPLNVECVSSLPLIGDRGEKGFGSSGL